MCHGGVKVAQPRRQPFYFLFKKWHRSESDTIEGKLQLFLISEIKLEVLDDK
jgi:hypothetical protein